MLFDGQGRCLKTNRTGLTIMGCPEHEVIGKRLKDYFPEAIRSDIDIAVEKVLTGRQSAFSAVQFLPGRREILWNALLNPIFDAAGKVCCFTGIFADITEQALAEEALADSEEKYRTLFESATDAIFIIDADSPDAGRIVSANKAAARIQGCGIDELNMMKIQDLDTPEAATPTFERFGRILSGEQLVFEVEHVRKDGSVFPVEVNAGLITIKGHRYVLAFERDITERKLALEALSRSEKKFRDLLETIRLLAVMLDCDGNINFCNDFLLSLTGWARDEVIGRNWFDIFIPAGTRSSIREVFRAVVSGAQDVSHYENSILTSDGNLLTIVWDNTTLHSPEGSVIGTASIGVNVTEHRKLEEQLRRSQKLEAIGQLAGGVAHDFNNILSAIIGYGHLIHAKLDDRDPLKNYNEQILHAAENARTLTQSLLSFGRKQLINPKPVDLKEIVTNHEGLLSRLIREDIEIILDCPGDCLVVLADRGQIEQILMNLVTNARDAMPSGGRLVIGTKKTAVDQAFIDAHGYGEIGDYAVLSVSDSGQGMDAKTKERIFEPFFTTKEQGKGTGLGLSTVYGIVMQHSGHITVNSIPAMGTTFRIYLPLVRQTDTPARASNEMVRGERGSETILVAEDDEAVRKLTCTILQHHGYRVIEAVDGQDAVAKFGQNRDSVNLVILDGIMPRKSGKEAYTDILSINPAVKTIFVSGYTETVVSRNPGISFIRKPFSPPVLLKNVREVLDGIYGTT